MGAANNDLVMAMNEKLNARIAEEVGNDDGSFLPIRDGKWFFPIRRIASGLARANGSAVLRGQADA